MDEKREWWIDAEIDPKGMNNTLLESLLEPEKFEEKHPNKKIGRSMVEKEGFLVFYQVMKRIVESVSCRRKARIVVEYDPRQEYFSIGTVTEHDEASAEEAER